MGVSKMRDKYLGEEMNKSIKLAFVAAAAVAVAGITACTSAPVQQKRGAEDVVHPLRSDHLVLGCRVLDAVGNVAACRGDGDRDRTA
jgi:hypothetical protein